jgi:putative protein kinase ArgK-like GTPase of G3E family
VLYSWHVVERVRSIPQHLVPCYTRTQVRSLPPPVSLLLVGRPGLGKTTLLRDIARHLADDEKLAVVVVDTSLEIGGEGGRSHAMLT